METKVCPKWITTKNAWKWYEKLLGVKPKYYQKEIVIKITKVKMPKATTIYAEGVLEVKCSGQKR